MKLKSRQHKRYFVKEASFNQSGRCLCVKALLTLLSELKALPTLLLELKAQPTFLLELKRVVGSKS